MGRKPIILRWRRTTEATWVNIYKCNYIFHVLLNFIYFLRKHECKSKKGENYDSSEEEISKDENYSSDNSDKEQQTDSTDD